MIQDRSIVEIADNSGAKIGRIFKVLGSSKKRYARIGDIVVLSVQKAEPRKAVKKKEVLYAYTEADRDRILKDLGRRKPVISRFKGLGEMNAGQLWETTMDPNKRTLLLVTIEDAAAADRTFDMLMGEAVPPRRRFIQTHAHEVRNLDI